MLKTIDLIGGLKSGWHFNRHPPSHNVQSRQKALISDGFHAIPFLGDDCEKRFIIL
jgi:hypothetical protein